MATARFICRTPVARAAVPSLATSAARTYATTSPARAHHKVVIVGGGTAGVTVAAQLLRAQRFDKADIAIVEPSSTHHYQPGWTLVGSGLKELAGTERPLRDILPEGVQHYPLRVSGFDPENNLVKTAEGTEVTYDFLVAAPGLETNFAGVDGLPAALEDPAVPVSTIYSPQGAEKTWQAIRNFKKGKAIFTQPVGGIKCAGAPQKIMWMALSQWKKDGVRDQVDITFATGAPTMFAVPKYSQVLDALRQQRNVEGLFQHSLTAVDAKNKTATFKNLVDGGKEVTREFDLLHVVPPQKPFDFVAKSALADEAGWVAVDKATTQHTKFPNVFSIGDASSLPNSKTAAAISAQAPVLVHNLLRTMAGAKASAEYDGYASCPLLTGHGELMLCEFKYGGVPKETFAGILGDQADPSRVYYHLKKDFFPAVYWSSFVKGTWFGPKGWFKPQFD